MTQKMYTGVADVAKLVKKIYVGVNGAARKVKKAYVGVSGVAKQCYSAEAEIKTPNGVSLIPTMTTNNMGANGSCALDSVANAANNVTADGTITLYASAAWKIFQPLDTVVFDTESGAAATKKALRFWYILGASMYNNGFFDEGNYTFTTKMAYANQTATNNCFEGLVQARNASGTWVQVAIFYNSYPTTPYTKEVTFNVPFKFNAIRFEKTNSQNYSHTRGYKRYGTQLKRNGNVV